MSDGPVGADPSANDFVRKRPQTMQNQRREPDPGQQQAEPWHRRELAGAPWWLIAVVCATAGLVILPLAYLTSAT